MPVLNRIAAMADDLRDWRHWLHRNPELSFDLPKTSAFVAARLREMGVDEIHEGIAETGIVAIINGQAPGDTIGLRADMDALPITEETGAAHASETPGRMHACGHDGHTTMLLGAAAYLCETRAFAGRAALLFQPAEENGGGGRVMVEAGVMDRFAIREVYGIHNEPSLPEGHFATAPGPVLAAVDDFRITVRGRGGHAAYPDLCVDPIPPALALAQALGTIVSRNRPPTEALVVGVSEFHAGSAPNIVPDTARIAGTVRSYSAPVRDMAEARVRDIADGVARSFGVAIEIDYSREYPATVNHARETAFAAEVAREVVGDDRVSLTIPPKMGAEDFSYMLEARPGAFLFLGQDTAHFCHHPKFDFNDAVAPIGASFFARLVERALPLARGGPDAAP